MGVNGLNKEDGDVGGDTVITIVQSERLIRIEPTKPKTIGTVKNAKNTVTH